MQSKTCDGKVAANKAIITTNDTKLKRINMNTSFNTKHILPCLAIVFTIAMITSPLAYAEEADAMPIDGAFAQLPGYQYGQNLKPLLRIEKEVFASMNEPANREKIAARLGAILASDKSSLAAKQFACLQLRQVGTEKEVPQLQAMLVDKQMRQDAYLALYQIPGEASTNVLRDAFAQAVIESDDNWTLSLLGFVIARKDVPSRELLVKLVQTDSEDAVPSAVVRRAAIRTLGKIANTETEKLLFNMAKTQSQPTSSDMVDALQDIIQARCEEGKSESIRPMLTFLMQPQQKAYVRRAAFLHELTQQADSNKSFALFMALWLSSKEEVKQEAALALLARCSKKEATTLLTQIDAYPHPIQVAVVDSLSRRQDPEINRELESWTDDGDNPERLLLALQLGLLSDTAVHTANSQDPCRSLRG